MPTAPKIVPLRPNYTRPPRKTTTERGYGSEHERIRTRLLAEHPLCQVCEKQWATDLHHRDGNPFNRDRSNCLMVCEPCHHGTLHGQ